MVTVQFSELLDAFQFVGTGAPYESSAFVNLDTGAIHCTSSVIELEEKVPENLETSDRYIAVPHKNDLDLGRNLALSFVEQQLPADYKAAADFFRSRGAYSRFKDLLAEARCTSRCLPCLFLYYLDGDFLELLRRDNLTVQSRLFRPAAVGNGH